MKLTAPEGAKLFIGPHLLLPTDKARHVGEAVAMVVARTQAQAADAAELVEVEYEELPSVGHSVDALKPGAPTVWDETPGNVVIDTRFGDSEATARGFAAADHVVRMAFHVGRVTAVPLEPPSALGIFYAASGRYTPFAGSGGAGRPKHQPPARPGIAPKKPRVLSDDVGGNFAARNRAYLE